jgi:hypothetical protein
VLYVVGLPAAVLWILWRRRHKLFGSPTDPFVASTRATFGFLYADYGSNAWWWEVEELLRKLLLSAVVVLIDEGSPLQVTLAVLVSGWAHVLHAQYKPWGAGSVLYSLQHGALFVTSFVFLMGLLFKVDGVSSSSSTYSTLSRVMVTLCVAFMAAWLAVIAVRVVAMSRIARKSYETRRQSRLSIASGNTVASGPVDGGDAGTQSLAAAHAGVRLVALRDGDSQDGDNETVSRRPHGFVVVNPLRHVKVDSARGGSAAGAANAGAYTDTAVPTARGGDDEGRTSSDGRAPPHRLSGGTGASGGKPVAVSRMQRVLAAQQPVPALTRDGQRLDTQ